MFLSSGASLQLIGSRTVFVHDRPSSASSEDVPDEILVMTGTVKLSLSKPQAVQSITVHYSSRHQLLGSQGFHASSGILYAKTLALHEDAQIMAGVNSFEYSIFLPPSTASQTCCRYGRVYGRLEATVKFAGRMARDLTTDMPVSVVFNPAPVGGLPRSLVFEVQQFSDDLGPRLVQAEAAPLTPSNLAHFQFSFFDPPHRVHIDHLEAFFKQTFVVHDPCTNMRRPTDVTWIPLFRLDASNKDQATIVTPKSQLGSRPYLATKPFPSQPGSGPFATLEPHQEVAFRLLLRRPDDKVLRATTGPATETPMRASHELVINIKYQTQGEAPRRLVLSQSVTVLSCCCLMDSLVLPTYSKDGISANNDLLSQLQSRQSDCICGASLEQVMCEAFDSGLVDTYTTCARDATLDSAPGVAKAAA